MLVDDDLNRRNRSRNAVRSRGLDVGDEELLAVLQATHALLLSLGELRTVTCLGMVVTHSIDKVAIKRNDLLVNVQQIIIDSGIKSTVS